MKSSLSIFPIMVCSLSLGYSQSHDNWHAFTTKDGKIGYVDNKGIIKVAPRHISSNALTFERIIAVTDFETNKSYYLLRNGKRIGVDSLYSFDNGNDCDSEGKIMFRDHKTDKVGFFDSNGRVVIPPNMTMPRHFIMEWRLP